MLLQLLDIALIVLNVDYYAAACIALCVIMSFNLDPLVLFMFLWLLIVFLWLFNVFTALLW